MVREGTLSGATWPKPPLFFFFFNLLELRPWHMEVPRLGGELELKLPAYTTAHGNAGS